MVALAGPADRFDEHIVRSRSPGAAQFASACFASDDENPRMDGRLITAQDFTKGVAVDEREDDFGDDERRRAHERLRERIAFIECLDDFTAFCSKISRYSARVS
jgi:hypothetical protein